MKNKKTPIGLMPKAVHDAYRADDIRKAMTRYLKAGLDIPLEWIAEYNSLKKKEN